jgi:predicted permease
MRRLRGWLVRVGGLLGELFHKEQRDQDLAEELESHLQMHIEENLRRGLTREDARRQALIQIGGMEQTKENYRDQRGFPLLESLIHDVRFGLRMLHKNPVFTAVAILTLALGIGANTAIFTLLDAVLLKTLPVYKPHELVLFSDDPSEGTSTGRRTGLLSRLSYSEYLYFQGQNEPFRDLCAFENNTNRLRIRLANAAANSPPEFAKGKVVSGNYFSVLGVNPAVGRLLSPEDDRPGASPTAVMSYAYWQGRFRGDPSVIGRAIEVNGTSFTVVGVAAPEFFGESVEREDFWFPIVTQPQVTLSDSVLDNNDFYWLNFMGRLKPGVTWQQAQAIVSVQLRQILAEQAGSHPSADDTLAMNNSYILLAAGGEGISYLRFRYSQPLHILMVVAGLILLIACANVANLMLSRAAAREKEISVRLALGASRGRLIRQLLTESALLACLGGALGILLAQWAAKILFTLVAGNGTPLKVSLNLAVLAFTTGVSLVAGILFGLVPALSASRADIAASMKGAIRAGASSGLRLGFANGLVVFQVAVSLPLLIGAGLFLRTLQNLMAQELGFEDDRVLVARIANPQIAGYSADQLPALYQSLLGRVQALPGVRSATLDSSSPFSGNNSSGNFSLEGRALQPGQKMNAWRVQVGARYFETMGIPILLGRDITPEDIQENLRVAIINQTMARKYFPSENPIGKRYCEGAPFSADQAIEIIGVAGDARYYSFRDQIPPMAFTAVSQLPRGGFIVVRAAGNPKSLEGAVRGAIREVSSVLPVPSVDFLGEQVHDRLLPDRTVAELSSIFGALALLLACIGLYGTMAYRVARRTNEIGIRMALGAQCSNVLWLILKECLLLVAMGFAIGVPLALAGTRLIASQLFELSPMDPLTVALAAFVMATVAALAGFMPARRASRVDPLVALRYE